MDCSSDLVFEDIGSIYALLIFLVWRIQHLADIRGIRPSCASQLHSCCTANLSLLRPGEHLSRLGDGGWRYCSHRKDPERSSCLDQPSLLKFRMGKAQNIESITMISSELILRYQLYTFSKNVACVHRPL